MLKGSKEARMQRGKEIRKRGNLKVKAESPKPKLKG
jgi:hypothetical protein